MSRHLDLAPMAPMARATGESPRGRIHIPIHRGIDALPSTYTRGRGTNMQEYMDRSEDSEIRQKRHISYIPEPRGRGGWLAWPSLINFGFKTLLTVDRDRERDKEGVSPLAAAQVALRRSRNDRYFEPLFILPSSENFGGGGGAVMFVLLAN